MFPVCVYHHLTWNKPSYLCFSNPGAPMWERKDLAAGQRVIPTSQTSGIFGLQVFRQRRDSGWGKLFLSPPVGCCEPR
ncbi:hypothetical protein EYF80_029779 [Liparis tanakae]|uniref:Uncharacterized protein n=1 Tax=Liparis tanakae TaxID=230148 RepID=A0A4Z2H344_9TELE|nr:hypothetical protein EYF80_029779 [Liparis tanakae]